MANVKKRKHFKRWRNGFRAYYYGMYWCRVLIWKFIMGNPSNFEGGNNEFLEHFRSSISLGCSCAGIIRNVINGSCFSIERFSLYLRQLVKLN
jgi:hypothetical protein